MYNVMHRKLKQNINILHRSHGLHERDFLNQHIKGFPPSLIQRKPYVFLIT